jgi:hypothetical protein
VTGQGWGLRAREGHVGRAREGGWGPHVSQVHEEAKFTRSYKDSMTVLRAFQHLWAGHRRGW